MRSPELHLPTGPAPDWRTARLPEGLRVYAFGDVHGRTDLLRGLRDEIRRHIGYSDPARTVVIGLGDYVDRGPDSRGVIDLLLEAFGADVETVLLRGNHEELLLRFLDQPEAAGPAWLRMGGLHFLQSYDVDIRPYAGASPDLQMARDDLIHHLPSKHLALLQAMPTSRTLGDYLFVHAGVRVGVPSTRQKTEDLLWIRTGFSDRDEPFEKVVVHGHTPSAMPYSGRYRINVDTAAYASGRLTCVILEGSRRQMLQIVPSIEGDLPRTTAALFNPVSDFRSDNE